MKFWPAIGFLLICYCEYYLDFKLQRREVAVKKSENFEFLSEHILSLIGGLFFPVWLVFGIKYGAGVGGLMSMFYVVINGIIHGVIDWNIWRFYKRKLPSYVNKFFEATSGQEVVACPSEKLRLFKERRYFADDPEFYNTIGLDRNLHFGTLFVLYCWFI